MTCPDVEILLCDYLDATLAPAQRTELEAHLAQCRECAGLAADAGAGFALLERTPEVHPPQELITRIMHQAPESHPFASSKGIRGWFSQLLEPVRQPRYVMGAMMTILSLTMMTRCAGVPVRQIQAQDLNPQRVWTGLETRVERVYDRSMKSYESMRLVYEVRQAIQQLREQQQEQDAAAPVEQREIQKEVPASGPASAPPGEPGRK